MTQISFPQPSFPQIAPHNTAWNAPIPAFSQGWEERGSGR